MGLACLATSIDTQCYIRPASAIQAASLRSLCRSVYISEGPNFLSSQDTSRKITQRRGRSWVAVGMTYDPVLGFHIEALEAAGVENQSLRPMVKFKLKVKMSEEFIKRAEMPQTTRRKSLCRPSTDCVWCGSDSPGSNSDFSKVSSSKLT
jgi:hypothetical protein